MIRLRRDLDSTPDGVRIKLDVDSQHSVKDVSDHGDEHRIDGVDSIIENLTHNPMGDLEVDPSDFVDTYANFQLAKSISEGGDW